MDVATTFKAWKAFGRNDLRGTYRDPLLVMIVLAPSSGPLACAL
jgi:fluoroquinolone transport system permease protein